MTGNANDQGEPMACGAATLAQEMLRNAMRTIEGTAPAIGDAAIYENSYFRMTHSEFEFSIPGGGTIHYRLGGNVIVDCPDPALAGVCQLYLWGTVMGAVAWFNRLMPLHCSAIGADERAYAFTGPSGVGKSTLAAALAQRGFSHVCDDTMVIAEQDGLPFVIPDGKLIKLWADALEVSGLRGEREVATLQGKFYAKAPNPRSRPCRLAGMFFIEDGPSVAIEPIAGGEKLESLAKAIYRGFVPSALGDHIHHAQMMLLVAENSRFWTLRRPRDAAQLGKTIDQIARLIEQVDQGA